MRWLGATVALLVLFAFPVTAEEAQTFLEQQWNASGASSLFGLLPKETQQLFSSLGLDAWSVDSVAAMSPQTVFSTLSDVLSSSAHVPCFAAAALLGGLLLLGLYTSFQSDDSAPATVFRVVAMLAVMTPLLVPLWQTVERVRAAAESATVFTASFAPVYAAILFSQGFSLSAASYQTVLLGASQGLCALVEAAIVPLLCMSLALSIAGAMHPTHRLGETGDMLGKTAVWLLGASVTVFVGLLSFQTLITASADSVGGRMLRFSVAGAVPVVGGSLADALYTVRGCLSALRGTVGGFGVLCTALIILPTLCECAVWSVLLSVCRSVAGLFSFAPIVAAVSAAQTVFKTLIGALASLALLMIVAVSVVSVTGGGAL